MKTKNIIGQRVKAARIMHNPPLSQSDLLAKLHLQGLYISQPSLSRIEHGLRTVPDYELLEIAAALRVDVGWLLGQYTIKI